MAAEIAHRAVAEVPPAVPPRAGEVGFVVRTRGRRSEPEVEVIRRRNRHLLLEAIDDLDAFVESVRMIELLGRCRVLQAPGAVRPDVNLPHRPDYAGHQDFLDRAPGRRGVAL